MAEITTSQIGNGTTAYGSDIVVKDLDLDVSNRVNSWAPLHSNVYWITLWKRWNS